MQERKSILERNISFSVCTYYNRITMFIVKEDKLPDYKIIETTYEVWTTIKKIHESDLHVFSSFSDPTGTFNGGPGLIGKMFTAYGFKDSDFPIMEAETTWDIDDKDKAIRGSEKYKYWLCLPIKEESKDD